MASNAARVLPISRGRKSRAGDVLLGREWYMRPDALQGLRVLAEKRLGDPTALTAWADAALPDTQFATIRDGVATVAITGPMERTWGFWSWLFGTPTYEQIAVELQRLRDNAAVRATVLAFDTPGGMVNGCGELAGIIRQCDDAKPVFGHAVGNCCSAGYYLASATRQIYTDRTAVLGCIGTCATFVDFSGMEEMLGIEVIQIVSTQSPRKNPDPATDEGRADWQKMLDSLAAVFITDVAEYRGVDEATVLADFGQGGVFVGQEAIDAGLADVLGTHESVHEAVLAALDSPDSDLTEETAPMPAATRTRRPAASAGAPIPAKVQRTRAEADKADDEKEEKEAPGAVEDDEDEEDDDEDEEEEKPSARKPVAERVHAIAIATTPTDVAAHFRAEGAEQERARVLGIHGLTAKVKSPKAQAAILAGMKDPKATRASVAEALVDSGAYAGAAALAGRAADEEQLNPPSNAESGDAAASEDDRTVAFVLNAGKPRK